MCAIEGLTTTYGAVRAADDVTMRTDAAVRGATGTGRTTVLPSTAADHRAGAAAPAA